MKLGCQGGIKGHGKMFYLLIILISVRVSTQTAEESKIEGKKIKNLTILLYNKQVTALEKRFLTIDQGKHLILASILWAQIWLVTGNLPKDSVSLVCEWESKGLMI